MVWDESVLGIKVVCDEKWFLDESGFWIKKWFWMKIFGMKSDSFIQIWMKVYLTEERVRKGEVKGEKG